MNPTAEEHLPAYRVRPRFEVETELSADVLTEKIAAGLAQPNAPCKGRADQGYISLYLPQEDQHYWSPRLSITLEDTEKGTLLRGMYGPRPAVWTMFIFFYALIGFAIVVVAIIGLSNLSLDKSAGILWLVPLLVLAFLSLYLVAYFGQKMGHSQMVILHQFVEETTGLTIDGSS